MKRPSNRDNLDKVLTVHRLERGFATRQGTVLIGVGGLQPRWNIACLKLAQCVADGRLARRAFESCPSENGHVRLHGLTPENGQICQYLKWGTPLLRSVHARRVGMSGRQSVARAFGSGAIPIR